MVRRIDISRGSKSEFIFEFDINILGVSLHYSA